MLLFTFYSTYELINSPNHKKIVVHFGSRQSCSWSITLVCCFVFFFVWIVFLGLFDLISMYRYVKQNNTRDGGTGGQWGPRTSSPILADQSTLYRGLSSFQKLGGQVLMRRAAADRRRLLFRQNMGGNCPPLYWGPCLLCLLCNMLAYQENEVHPIIKFLV